MDFPTEIEVPEIGPKQGVDLLIKPVFSNRISKSRRTRRSRARWP